MGGRSRVIMSFNAEWTCAELSHGVCDALVAAEKLRVKPAFIRADREVKITGVFESAGLDGAKMTTCNARGVEVPVKTASTAVNQATKPWTAPNQDRKEEEVEEAKSATTVARWVTFPVNALMVLLVVTKVAETTARVVVEAGKQSPQDGHESRAGNH